MRVIAAVAVNSNKTAVTDSELIDARYYPLISIYGGASPGPVLIGDQFVLFEGDWDPLHMDEFATMRHMEVKEVTVGDQGLDIIGFQPVQPSDEE